MKKILIKLKNKLSSIIKIKLGKHINKKTEKLNKKVVKHHNFSDWFFCVVCSHKYKNVSLKNRLKMYANGFTSDEYVDYNFEKNNMKEYITEVERWKSREINGKYNVVLDDKRLFYEAFCKYIKIPKTLFYIVKGKFLSYEKDEELSLENIFELLNIYKGLVIRPISDGGGRGICIVKQIGDKIYLNDDECDKNTVKDVFKGQNDSVVSEYVFQHKYANDIFDKSVNTIRIVTIQKENGKAEIPIALHRFGTKESIPVDNACNGGIFSIINLENGTIGKAKSYRTDEIYTKHPDSKAQIEGITVPRWNEIKEKVIYVANRFPYIKFIAWDIALTTNDEINAIEGNASTGLNVFQSFEPLKNTSLGEFYKKYNVIK